MKIEHIVKVDSAIVECAQTYIDFVRERVAVTGGQLFIEQRVPIGHITGEDGAGGTSDTIIIADGVMDVIDLKGGMGKVDAFEVVRPAMPCPITGDMLPPVTEPNSQLALYAGGALEKYGLLFDIHRVRMTIVQPRLNHVSEYEMSVEELQSYLAGVAAAARATRENPTFVPGDHCHFCKGKDSCFARANDAAKTALEGFDSIADIDALKLATPRSIDDDMLGVLYGKVGAIQKVCEDVVKRVYARVTAGHTVRNADGIAYKLVAGKRGARAWTSVNEAEAALKKMRLRKDEMYDFSLISPTTADALAHPKPKKKGEAPPEPLIGAKQWEALQSLITQAQGKPTLALETDPRPAVASAVDGFDDTTVSQPSADNVDYFS